MGIKQDKCKIEDLYKTGHRICEISRETGYSRSQVSRVIIDAGLRSVSKRILEIPELDILSRRDSGMTAAEIGRELGTSGRSIMVRLRMLGLGRKRYKNGLHKLIDMSGQTIGEIKVESISRKVGKQGKYLWNCHCLVCKTKYEFSRPQIMRRERMPCPKCLYPSRYDPDLQPCGEITYLHMARIRRGAISRELEMEVKADYLWRLFLRQKRKCKLTDLPLTMGRLGKEGRKTTSASLDRIDSDKGYVKGNVRWIHKELNFLKGDLSDERLLYWVEQIWKYHANC